MGACRLEDGGCRLQLQAGCWPVLCALGAPLDPRVAAWEAKEHGAACAFSSPCRDAHQVPPSFSAADEESEDESLAGSEASEELESEEELSVDSQPKARVTAYCC